MFLLVSLTPDMDDETPSAKVERGDVEAFTVVYNKHHELLYVLAYHYLIDKAMAGDTMQHVFMRFQEFRSELHVGISLKNYLVTMTKNHILSVIRNENNVITESYEIAQSIPEYKGTLVKNPERKEMMSLFHKALDKLPPQKREICLMKVRNKFTNPGIAEYTQLSVNTVRTHYSEASKLLRTHLHKLLVSVTYLTLLKHLGVLFTLWIVR